MLTILLCKCIEIMFVCSVRLQIYYINMFFSTKALFFFKASSEEVHLTPESSPELTKRSWFGSLLLSADKEETFTALVKGKPLATVKADLIHAFLSVS